MLIKKYRNRKLYDVQASKYVNLSHVQDAVSKGVKVEIIDHDTQKDVTADTLVQILLKLESLKSSEILHDLIKKDG
jgi:polyhydroxyalkanoate synthesis repressor PhaR